MHIFAWQSVNNVNKIYCARKRKYITEYFSKTIHNMQFSFSHSIPTKDFRTFVLPLCLWSLRLMNIWTQYAYGHFLLFKKKIWGLLSSSNTKERQKTNKQKGLHTPRYFFKFTVSIISVYLQIKKAAIATINHHAAAIWPLNMDHINLHIQNILHQKQERTHVANFQDRSSFDDNWIQ